VSLPSTPEQADAKRWKALAVCLGGSFITMLDVSIVNVALPSMQKALHAGSAQLQLIVAGYTLAIALLVVPAGRIGDAKGRRLMFIIGVAGFGVMSLLAGLAHSDTYLSVVRLLQGAFGGILSPQTSGLIQQMFRGKERGKAFGLMGAMIGVATALGPVVGGALVTLAGPSEGWRWVFFINVPIVLVVVPLAYRLLPPRVASDAPSHLDVPGVALIGLAAAVGMVPFIGTGEQGEPSLGPWRWWMIAVAILILGLFLLWERRYQTKFRAAVLDPSLIRNVGYRFGVMVGVAYFGGFNSVFLIITMVLQRGLGYSALMAGLVSAPFAIGSGAAAPVAGRMVGRFGRSWMIGGLVLMLAGLAAMNMVLRWTPVNHVGWAMAIAGFFTGLGSGSVISPNQTLTLASVPPRIGGVASGVVQVSQRVATAVGMSIVLSGFFANYAPLGARGAAAKTLIASMAMIGVALVVAIIDWYRRRHHTEVLG